MTSQQTGFAGARLLTEKETAATLKISVGWLRQRRALGIEPYALRCGHAIRYDSEELCRFIKANTARKDAA